ncbi:twin-arginine translocase subunit TatC [Aeoliella mucimassa]|uniref:Sec-independent protein translocase protein TatC n=1 Tax=Aeoliella mucimassa TaxID=2527972 RepID=A0A518ANG5_9BACT|nr:twin-arginine translocase subunit TatC [Aeoliella mucimassa]QDU56256.1 Sec-independent protein translocase protein TatCy [Aeoliella mucimassa]
MPAHDDLFEKSKMTFGEHLEELRSALIKSILAIAIGFLIGMYFASWFVGKVKEPLQDAIDEYVLEESTERYTQELLERKKKGEDIPEDIDAAVKIRKEKGLAPKIVFMEPKQLGIESDEELVPITQWQRVEDNANQIIATGVTQGFMVWIKAALVLGIVFSSPAVFWFVWQFVAAGLYPHEKQYVHIFLPFSLLLFLAGAALAFYGAIYYVLQFLFSFYKVLGVAPYPVINEWMSFIMFLPIGFGIGFQLPLVMLFLERIGIFNVPLYLKQWKIAVVVICVISTILTPADPQSMILMAVPLVILYFGGIGLCRYMPRRKKPFSEVVSGEE